MFRKIAAGAAFASAITVAGCATAPPRPAMVPFSETGEYGFSETRLAPDRYEVRYVTPRLRVSGTDPGESAEIQAERQRAFDLALWRAAQLALENGFSAFTVEQDNRDVALTVRTEPVLSPFWGYPYYDRFDRFGPYYPYYPYYPYASYSGYRTWATARVTVALEVAMLEEPTEKSYDASATAARLQEAYGAATFPGS